MGEPGLLCPSHGLAGSQQGNGCPGSWEEATGKLQRWQEAGSWPHLSSRGGCPGAGVQCWGLDGAGGGGARVSLSSPRLQKRGGAERE